MVVGAVWARFIDQAPVCVMVRATVEQLLAADQVNAVFEITAAQPYTRELLLSTVVDIMSLVVCRVYKSVHAAYVKKQEEVAVSVQALYDKLNRVEPAMSRELTRPTARAVRTLLLHLNGLRADESAGGGRRCSDRRSPLSRPLESGDRLPRIDGASAL